MPRSQRIVRYESCVLATSQECRRDSGIHKHRLPKATLRSITTKRGVACGYKGRSLNQACPKCAIFYLGIRFFISLFLTLWVLLAEHVTHIRDVVTAAKRDFCHEKRTFRKFLVRFSQILTTRCCNRRELCFPCQHSFNGGRRLGPFVTDSMPRLSKHL